MVGVMVSCLFCTSNCNKVVQDSPGGHGDHDKNIDNDAGLFPAAPDSEEEDGDPAPLLFQEDPAVREQLKAYFILSKILKIPNESICDFLREKNGHSKLEFWAKVCGACAPLVRLFYDTLSQISKLERILVGIEVELKGKVVKSKDSKLEGPTVNILKNIRAHLLEQYASNSNGEDSQVNLADYLIQDWNIYEKSVRGGLNADDADQEQGFQTSFDTPQNDYDECFGDTIEFDTQSQGLNVTETIVKTEVVDLGHFPQPDDFLPKEEVEESVAIPIWQPPFHLSFFDDEEVEPETSFNLEHQYRPSKNLTETKKLRRRLQKPSSNPNYTIFIEHPRGSNFPRKAYQCVHCPYTSFKIKFGIGEHFQLHEPGSRAVPCPECDIHVLPERLLRHKGLRHPQIRSKVIRREMKELTKLGQPSNKSHTNPNYRKVKEASGFYKKTSKFACNLCNYRTFYVANIKAHIELHKEGSTAIPCKKCRWFVLPEDMQLHNENNHPKRNGDGKGRPPLFKCSMCPFEFRWKQKYEGHQVLHKEGSGAIHCPDCDCYMRQPLFNHQKSPLCAKLRRRKTMKEAGQNSQNENEQNDL